MRNTRRRKQWKVQPIYSVPASMKKKSVYPSKYLIGYKINGKYVPKNETKEAKQKDYIEFKKF